MAGAAAPLFFCSTWLSLQYLRTKKQQYPILDSTYTMKICRSLSFAVLLTTVRGFVGPQTSATTGSRTQLAATSSDDMTTGDVIKGLAFSALFGFAMVFNPLPSSADGTVDILCFLLSYLL